MVMITESVDLDAEIRAYARKEPSLRGFAYTVPGLENLGQALGAKLASYLYAGEDPLQVVVLPRQRLLQRRYAGRNWSPFPIWRQTPEQILVHTPNQLVLATICEGCRLEVISTPLDQIVTMQIGTILLFSWFEWSWANNGNLETTKIYFNTVSDRIFRELQQSLSRKWFQLQLEKLVSDSQTLNPLENLPYKFRNIIPLRLLLPEETVLAVVYRPGLWEPRVVFFKRQTSPATTLVLTNGQVLVAEEEPGMAERHYGVIARYIPRRAIQHAVLEESTQKLILRISCRIRGVEFEQCLEFEPEAKLYLDEFIAQLNQHTFQVIGI